MQEVYPPRSTLHKTSAVNIRVEILNITDINHEKRTVRALVVAHQKSNTPLTKHQQPACGLPITKSPWLPKSQTPFASKSTQVLINTNKSPADEPVKRATLTADDPQPADSRQRAHGRHSLRRRKTVKRYVCAVNKHKDNTASVQKTTSLQLLQLDFVKLT